MKAPARFGSVLLLSLAACPPTFDYPPGAQVTCEQQSDCPPNLQCKPALGLCVPMGQEDVPPAVESFSVAATRVAVGGDAVLTFKVGEKLGKNPTVLLKLQSGDLEATFESVDDNGLDYAYRHRVAEPPTPSGSAPQRADVVTVIVDMVDLVGNHGVAEFRAALAFDYLGPKSAGAQVFYRPGPDNAVAQPEAATVGSEVVVTFITDEAVDPVVEPKVWATCGASAPATLPFARLAGETDSQAFTYSAVLPGVDGPCTLAAQMIDVVGNESEDDLGGVQVLVDRAAPPASSPPAVARLLHLRLPWGAERSAGEPGHFLVPKAYAAGDPLPGSEAVDCAKAPARCIPAADFLSGDPSVRALRAYGQREGGMALGTLPLAGEAFVPARLAGADSREIWLAQVDSAGNESPRVRVMRSTWVATLGGKVQGSSVENPNALVARRYFDGSLLSSDGVEVPTPAAVARVDDGLSLTTAGAMSWVQVAGGPPPITKSGMAFDRSRGRLVLFGGMRENRALSDVWEWDGRTWQRRPVADPERDGNPRPGTCEGFVYDESRGLPLMLDTAASTYAGGQAQTRLWEWSGASWRVRPTSDPEHDGDPQPGVDFSVAYDSARRRLVLFGGISASLGAGAVMHGETWESNGDSWEQRQVAPGSGPEARYAAAMAFRPASGKTVLFGGVSAAATLGDLWEWDGAAWTQLCPKTPSAPQCANLPPGRWGATMTYDAARGRLVMFGGIVSGAYVASNELWEWDGTTWTRRCDGVVEKCDPVPPPQISPRMAFDPLHREVLVFGGRASSGAEACPTCGLWRWNGQRWLQEPSQDWQEGAPAAREGHSMAFDAARGRAVIFGGSLDWEAAGTFPNLTLAQDTWEWDGNVWSRRCDYSPLADDCGTHPPTPAYTIQAGYGTAMASMPSTGTELLFVNRETWVWDGRTWSQRCSGSQPCDAVPRDRQTYGLAHDAGPAAGRVLMIGGADPLRFQSGASIQFFQETWAWDGLAWRCLAAGDASNRDPACPAPMSPHPYGDGGAVYDPARNVVVWFGFDADQQAETLEWDGKAWKRVPVTDPEGDGAPALRRGQVLAYSSSLRRALLFGGVSLDFSALDDLWAYDGASWQRLPLTDREDDRSPSARRYAGLVDMGEMWLHAGRGARMEGDLWRFDPALAARPQHIAFVGYGASGAPSPAGCASGAGCKVAAVDVLWRGGGSGRDPGGARDGAQLYAWRSDAGWTLLAESDSRTPAELKASIVEPQALDRLAFGDPQRIAFALAPKGANAGAQMASVTTDYVEVAVTYDAEDQCGDGYVGGQEQCDDGNLLGGDGCDGNCTVSRCGNGVAVAPETCDDGNEADGDGCSADCLLEGGECGDGVRNAGEECDDGNAAAGDGCDGNCTGSRCGNQVAAPPETCDDGNTVAGDGCSAECLLEGGTCGDGVRNAGEECDDGSPSSGDGCDVDCTVSRCGNRVVAPGESCDDGNAVGGDGCSATCLVEGGSCPDGVRNVGEECDDGNGTDGDGCDRDCTRTACGNGVRTAGEECDDGDLVSGDGCDSNCSTTRCGNGQVSPGESCDDGGTAPGDGCSAQCLIEGGLCGDLVHNEGEECDDGNLQELDGCSSACTLESTCLLVRDATAAIGGASLRGSTVGRFDQHQPSCSYGEAGPEVVYAVTAPGNGALRATTDHPGTDYETTLFARKACGDPGSEVGCARFTPASPPQSVGQPSLSFPVAAGDTYYLFVDGLGAGLYELSLEFGSSCAQAVDATASIGGAPALGTTVGAFNEVSGSCDYGFPAGGEAVFTVTPAKSGALSAMATAVTSGSYLVSVWDGCGGSAKELACGPSYATVAVTAGVTYTLVVDNWITAPSDFTLTLSLQ